MQSAVHRLLDLALENVALHTVGAWLLYDDAHGRRHVHCVPVSFADGPVEPGGHFPGGLGSVWGVAAAAGLPGEVKRWRGGGAALG